MNMPFGFGGFDGVSGLSGRRAQAAGDKPAPNKANRRARDWKSLRNRIQGGLDSGSTFGAMMGFMDLPWLSRNHGAGAPQYVRAEDFLGNGFSRAMGNGGGGGGGGADKPDDGGNDPGTGTQNPWVAPTLLYPPPIGTGEQWRYTMQYGA